MMKSKLCLNSFMKVRLFLSFSLYFSLSLALISCRDKETEEEQVVTVNPPSVRVNFLNKVGDSAIVAGHFYNRDGGEPFSLDLSSITFHMQHWSMMLAILCT